MILYWFSVKSIMYWIVLAVLLHIADVSYCNSNVDEHCSCIENKYDAAKNELSKEEMFKRGHLKPFGSHRPPLEVETLKYMISPEDFYMEFVAKHKPVVFTGVTQKWPAYKLWNDEYLDEKFGNTTMRMESKDDDKINLPGDRKFSEFLKVYRESSSNLYLVDEVTPKMREDVLLPLCLRCEEIDRFFFVSFYWHSNGGTMSTVHIDTDENLLCVIRGHKKVIMVSPIYTHDLYADIARQNGVLDLNSSSVDLEKYPRIMNIRHYEAHVNEGDCVYIPQMWWHQVYSRRERQQAIAMWWKSKPFWKKVASEGSTSVPFPPEQRKKHSYGDSLIDYEHWVQNVSSSLPSIRCNEQRKFMSEYSWETDKEEDAAPTLGDGGDLEEEVFESQELKSPSEIHKELEKHKQRRKRASCDFDFTNQKSPCHLHGVEEDDLDYIRYVLDYCQHYEDRGCVINKPQLLNKLEREEFQEMAFKMKSYFRP